MAITIVQSNLTLNPFTGIVSGTATGSLPSPVTTGNAVLIAFEGAVGSAKSVGTPIDDQGNTYTQLTYDNTVTAGQGWFLRTNITNGPHTSFGVPFTVPSSSPTIGIAVFEISGLDPSPADFANIVSSSFASTFNKTFTTVAANEMGFAILTNANGSGQAAVTMTNGWTLDFTNLTGDPRSAIAHDALLTAGTNSIQGSTTSGDLWNISIVSLKSAGASGGASLAAGAQVLVSGAASITTAPGGFVPILLDDPAHSGGTDQISMGAGPGTGTGDTAETAFTKLKQWAADVNAMTGKLFPVRSVQTPLTGFSIAAATGVTNLLLNPAGTLATGTVTLPQNPGDNQPFALLTSQAITALTANTADGTALNGAPTSLAANAGVKWRFVASLNTWFREQ